MSAIELKNVTKVWGRSVAVDNISFSIEDGSFVVLLGPSGCGKSTTLRMIAGLEDMTEGSVFIADQDMTHTSPANRHLSMVFQSYALFPHLNVRENILFGLKVRKVRAMEQAERLQKVGTMVGLSDLMERKPGQLSGGQRQRVALARAIIAENSVYLMDEPLSNLDAKLRQEMRLEIRALQKRLGMTVVYVTHDQTEAMSMADKIILMNGGRIEQIGTPDELYDTPKTVFAASFIGTPPMNILEVENSKVRSINGPKVVQTMKKVLLGIRPEHISIGTNGGIPGRIVAHDYLGAETIITVAIGNQTVLVRISGRSTFVAEDTVKLGWDSAQTHLFDMESGRRNNASTGHSIMLE